MRFRGIAGAGIVAILLLLGLGNTPVWAASAFADPAFQQTWERTDKPVRDHGAVGRGYTWGPAVAGSESLTTEPYNAGVRTVQYFDKGRMELNPTVPASDVWHVTTGLLVKELVSGARQDRDDFFLNEQPSSVPVAGDPNNHDQNPDAPTYASFRAVATLSGVENGQKKAANGLISVAIDRAGNITTLPMPPERRFVSAYDAVTQHNIADVFVAYQNQIGLIWQSQFVRGPVFYGNPLYVFGHPITEPYWTQAVVAGTTRNVLVQLFERRVLTYTPSNAAPYKVEMGNVGQHYYTWRYVANNLCTPAAPNLTFSTQTGDFPTDFSQFSPYHKSGPLPQGNTIVTLPLGATNITGAPAITGDQNLAVLGTEGGGVVGIRLGATPRETCMLWRYPRSAYPPTFPGTALLYNGVAYIGDTRGILHAINMADGTPRWIHAISTYTTNAMPITDGVNLYITAADGRLSALRIADGTEVWSSPPVPTTTGLNNYNPGPVFGWDGNIYYFANDEKIHGYGRDGTPKSATAIPDIPYFANVTARPVFANNTLYVLDAIGTLFALDKSGQIVKEQNFPGVASETPAVVGGRIYLLRQIGVKGGIESTVLSVATNDFTNVQAVAGAAEYPIIGPLTVVDAELYTTSTAFDLQQTSLKSGGGSGKLLFSQYAYPSPLVVANGRVYGAYSAWNGGNGTFYIVQ